MGSAGEDCRHAYQEGGVQRTGQTSFVVVFGLLVVNDPLYILHTTRVFPPCL